MSRDRDPQIPSMHSAKAVIAEKLARLGPSSSNIFYSTMPPQRPPSHTLTSLKRWSVANRELPAVSQIKAIHVYDFDNTLFLSPLPNPQLWNGSTIGFLQAWESFANGGWWHDPNILCATGRGMEAEEPRAWNGWWNEQILRLVKLSMDQKDALTVLLTGRGEANFAPIIKRMAASKKLDFDLIGLKPEVGPNGQLFPTTMTFKQKFLEDLVYTYEQAEEIRIYEDRPKHAKGFRDFFGAMNRSLQAGQGLVPRKPLTAEVIQVTEGCTYLDPIIETAEVQRMINSHNLTTRNPSLSKVKSRLARLRIKRTVFYTGYLISQQDSQRIIQDLLSPTLQQQGHAESNDLKYMANSILITPRPASQNILGRVGGLGKKVSWQVTGVGVFDNRVWAAQVAPMPSNLPIYTENPSPLIVLACRRGSRPADAGKIQNWQPVPPGMAMKFETVVGEKVVLRVEEDNPHEGEWESQFMNKSHKRRHQQERDEDILYPQSSHTNGYEAPIQDQSHGYHPYHRPGGDNRHHNDENSRRGPHRGRGRGNGRGRGSARGNRGRGRGGRDTGSNPYYKSLDDQGSGYEGPNDKGSNAGGSFPMDY
ncbi:uncharacterized protein N7482_009600 [Penicillium canariense]|uniref:Swiss Army Knife RNA repair protein HAD domain-containing protein n=1 Tax=Penicillium canariense TaxID=189055 RepID=A0A9W9HPP3_9EURO|nr:uncharacterized protein N7482_009600 [Penicillium canariense]KAJ5153122.1 hypothetical protein N7482_009600 [Penicillium canariense]